MVVMSLFQLFLRGTEPHKPARTEHWELLEKGLHVMPERVPRSFSLTPICT